MRLGSIGSGRKIDEPIGARENRPRGPSGSQASRIQSQLCQRTVKSVSFDCHQQSVSLYLSVGGARVSIIMSGKLWSVVVSWPDESLWVAWGIADNDLEVEPFALG